MTSVTAATRLESYGDAGLSLQSGFHLTKWYFDCVADDGDAAICYCAKVRWRKLRMHYSSLLWSRAGRTSTLSSLRNFPAPVAGEDSIALELPALSIRGTWQRRMPDFRRTLFETQAGAVEWHCLQPLSQAVLQTPDAEMRGCGYAECLTLTVPPWELPLERLQWGRFTSAENSLVWIDWQGPHQLRLVLHNGEEWAAREIGDGSVAWEGGRLALERSTTLREGSLGRTILPGAPLLRRIFPPALFGVRETKWCSRGRMHTSGAAVSGWAIHEVVDWSVS